MVPIFVGPLEFVMQMDFLSLFSYLGVGALAGLLAGLLGVGGGLVIVPALLFVFDRLGFSPAVYTHLAIGTSLATICLTSLGSIRAHHHAQAVDWLLVRRLALGLMLGAAMGAYVVHQLGGTQLQALLGVFVLLAAAKLVFHWRPKTQRPLPSSVGFLIAGGVIGWTSSFFGIGGGTLTVPFLLWCGIPIAIAIGTSSVCGFPIAMIGALAFMVTGFRHPDLPAWSTGYVYWPAWLGIVCTSVVFAPIGARLTHRLSARMLECIFAAVLVLVGVRLLLHAL